MTSLSVLVPVYNEEHLVATSLGRLEILETSPLLSRVQAQANRLADTVALFQALGGGWWNREDRDPPKPYPYFNLTD